MSTVRTQTASGDLGPRYELSIDTGGTFTDGFVKSRTRTAQVKVDTTPHDPTVGFGACVAAAAGAMGESLADFLRKTSRVHFSSTLATNLMVQRAGAKVGLIVTAGHEGSLYGSPSETLALGGFLSDEAVKGVTEEVDAQGRAVKSVDVRQLEEAVRQLLEVGVHLIVVSFAGAQWNPQNERSARAIIERSYPKHYLGAIHLMLSTEVSLVADDFGRTALAVANAYLHPSLSRSLYRAEDLVRNDGLQSPLLIVNTDGSSTRVAKTRAIDTFNSGPTAGVLGAVIIAEALNAEHVVTFDVGGTTTDVAYLRGGAASRTETTDFGGLGVPHSAVDLLSFGLGGGSVLAAFPTGGGISVGPTSAGAVPGPACFGLGGRDATPTDVWLALGYLEAGEFLGGRRRLEPQYAEEALARLAKDLNWELEKTILAAREAIRQTLAEHLRDWASGQDGLKESAPDRRWLFSYGGGGGLLCVEAAEALGIDNIVVFPQSSVFSAFGGGLLPIAHKYESLIVKADDLEEISSACRSMLDRAQRDLRTEGVTPEQVVIADVSLLSFDGRTSSARMARPFSELVEVEATAVRRLAMEPTRARLLLSVVVPRDRVLEVNFATGEEMPKSSRSVITDDGRRDIPIVQGLGRPSAQSVEGPCFLAAPDTTILVPTGWNAEFDRHGYGILRRGH